MSRLSAVRPFLYFAVVCVLFPTFTAAQSDSPGVPVVEVTPVDSHILFDVKASIPIDGSFRAWNATLTFKSPDPTTGELHVVIEADSVDTGSNMKNKKLKGPDFFDVKRNPTIEFNSTKVVQTGENTFELDGDFSVRGVTKPEKLTLTVARDGTGSAEINGTMVFDRKDYGMNSGIPFIKIADRVEVTIHLKSRHVSGPLVTLKKS